MKNKFVDKIIDLANKKKREGENKAALILFTVAGALCKEKSTNRLVRLMSKFAQDEINELNAPEN